MADFGAVLDANVIVPAAVRDTLLRAAEVGLYRPFWSDDILAEVERTIARLLREQARPDPEGQARRLVATLRAIFPEASVTGYEELIPTLWNDAKDRHVLAAAVVAQAQVIVTNNLRDFPTAALGRYHVEALTPDRFLCALFLRTPDLFRDLIRRQAAALQRPAFTVAELLNQLEPQVPAFVAHLRAAFA